MYVNYFLRQNFKTLIIFMMVYLHIIKKKTSNKVPCVWFLRQNLFSIHYMYLSLYCVVPHSFSIQVSTTLTHFLFNHLPSSCFSHILYSIIYHYSSCYSSHNFHSIVYNTLQFLMLLNGPLCWGAILVCLYVSFLWLLHQVGIHTPWVTHPVFVEW